MSRFTLVADIDAPVPTIILGETDHQRLTTLATAMLDRSPDVAEVLLAEMDRASVVATDVLPSDVVGMDPTIEFAIDGGETQRARLVFPDEANIDEDKLSILTPIGAALIGLSPNQSFRWAGPNGRPHRLTVVAVEPGNRGGLIPQLEPGPGAIATDRLTPRRSHVRGSEPVI
ncbi:regulator of nucleoside diphosphate kinase [Rhizobiales bacterium GAS113]|nr:regulator of nucleoside diphosphate kinase [Rhizobiales bacterium GAS113]